MTLLPPPVPLRLDLGEIDPDCAGLYLAADLMLPAAPPAALCVCYPGGGFTRRYFDLDIGGDRSRSFLRQMAARGLATVALDHLGIGDSARPADGFAFTPHRLADLYAAAVGRLRGRLAAGTLAAGVPAQGPLFSVGVGHSMGGLFVILQQAAHRPFDAVALLGSTAGGLIEALLPAERALAGDAAAIRAKLVALAQARFGAPYPEFTSHDPAYDAVFAGEDAAASAAIRATRGRMLALGGLLSMIPGGIAAEAAAITAPVLLASGDGDIGGSVQAAAARFSGSPDISLLVLPRTQHMHFGFAASTRLFDRLAGWTALVRST